jgi:transposase
MYFNYLVKIPEKTGRITVNRRGDTTYIEYTYSRNYVPEKKYNVPKRTTIGKQSKDDPTMMQPNPNFLKFFPEVELPDINNDSLRSSCIRVGAFIIIKKIMDDYGLPKILKQHFETKELGLFLDLVVYSIICENNAGQYYPDYAYNHPLFTEDMHIYSDSKVSDFLASITDDQSVGFLNNWNEVRNHREKIYISYDSTNKNCQAGDVEMAEFGHSNDGFELPMFNYSIAYDTNNREPLFYEEYPGSIVDVSQLQFMLEKAKGYGYKKIGFILDRGYFSKENIQFMDAHKYEFVIMVKGMASFVNQLVLENKGTFEDKRVNSIREYQAYGKTVKKKLYASDERERYFHIFHKVVKESAQREQVESKIERMAKFLKKQEGKVVTFGEVYSKYFELFMYEKDEVFMFAREKANVIERELKLCGYFVIVTSQKMTAREALSLYKSRDDSEKLFRGDKSYLGNKSMRVHSDESISAKVFVEFVALIVRCKIYTLLKSAMIEMEKKPNYMTVPAALKELEKIEMVRQLDTVYRLSHAITATQKTILKAFGVDVAYIKETTEQIKEQLVQIGETKRRGEKYNSEENDDID